MTDEDLEVWTGRAAAEEADAASGGRDEARRGGRLARMPVRWLVIPVVAVVMGVWINSYASLREQRDRALDALAVATGETRQSSRELELLRLESEFRSFDLLVLPEIDGLRTTLGIVNVTNAEGHQRTWLLLRGAGAVPGGRYRLDIAPCDAPADAEFPPFSTRHDASGTGDLEMTAQNLAIPADMDEVAVVLRSPDGDPLAGILGPLVLPRRIVTGARAGALC